MTYEKTAAEKPLYKSSDHIAQCAQKLRITFGESHVLSVILVYVWANQSSQINKRVSLLITLEWSLKTSQIELMWKNVRSFDPNNIPQLTWVAFEVCENFGKKMATGRVLASSHTTKTCCVRNSPTSTGICTSSATLDSVIMGRNCTCSHLLWSTSTSGSYRDPRLLHTPMKPHKMPSERFCYPSNAAPSGVLERSASYDFPLPHHSFI